MKSSHFTSLHEKWASVSLIVLITLITYAPLLKQLGFYRDDWYLLWTYESEGAQGLLKLFVGDRPFVGRIYEVDFSILGSNPLGWHIYTLFIKIVSAFALFWLLREIWPNRKIMSTCIVLLFIVYPGFYQQPNALTYKQLLLAYAAALLSLACTIHVLNSDRLSRKVLFSVLALVLAVFYVFIYEALIGMEAVRLLLIWFCFYRQNSTRKESIRLTAPRFLPYLIFALLFIFWRILIFQSTRKATNVDVVVQGYTSLHGLIRLLVETLKDVIESSVLAWGVPYYQFTVSAKYRDVALAFGLAILAVALSASYYSILQRQAKAEHEASEESRVDWLVLGAAIVFVTTLPIVAAGRNALFGIQWDRYTYQSSFGVALLTGGFVFYALRDRLRLIVLTLLLASGVATQAFSAMYYRDFWEVERAAWWQLYWRAPQIADGTTVIASLPGSFQLAEDYEIWGPLNLLYHRGESLKISAQVPYQQIVINLARGLQEERLVRGTVTVKRNYERTLVVSMPSEASCLRVYNGSLGLSLTESPIVTLMAPYSQTSLIQIDATSPAPPNQILGNEPPHRWCFYYQKINLALQAENWAGAARLADESISKDFRPEETAEWLPVLFAYANNGQPKKVKQTSKFIYDKYTRIYLCDQLRAVTRWPQGYMPELVINNLCTSE